MRLCKLQKPPQRSSRPMNKKAANAVMRAKYGASWFDRAGAKVERGALMRDESTYRLPFEHRNGIPMIIHFSSFDVLSIT